MYPEFDGSQPCRQVDPELFFPESGTPIESRMAKDMCSSCKFQAPCLRYALAFQVAGIWGGSPDPPSGRDRGRAAGADRLVHDRAVVPARDVVGVDRHAPGSL
jgi:hypothetical protein